MNNWDFIFPITSPADGITMLIGINTEKNTGIIGIVNNFLPPKGVRLLAVSAIIMTALAATYLFVTLANIKKQEFMNQQMKEDRDEIVKCNEYGNKNFDYMSQASEFGAIYFDQKFTFNRELNTCLAYYRYTTNLKTDPTQEQITDILHQKSLYSTSQTGKCNGSECVSYEIFREKMHQLFNED